MEWGKGEGTSLQARAPTLPPTTNPKKSDEDRPQFLPQARPWGKYPQWTYQIVSRGSCPCGGNDSYEIKYFSV